MKNKTILFDIDHTLFDASKYLSYIFTTIASELPDMDEDYVKEHAEKEYILMRETDVFHPAGYAKRVSKFFSLRDTEAKKIEQKLLDPTVLKSFLYEDVHDSLQRLSKMDNLTLGIFSSGDTKLQEAKIHSLRTFFSSANVHIFPSKEAEIPIVLNMYEEDQLHIVDDIQRILKEFKARSSSVITFWMDRGNSIEQSGFTPDFILSNLLQLQELV